MQWASRFALWATCFSTCNVSADGLRARYLVRSEINGMLCVHAGFKALGSAWTVEVGLSNPYLWGLTLKFLTKELPNWLTGEIQNIAEKFKNIAEKFKNIAEKFILPSGENTYRRMGENRRTFCENMRRLCEKVVWEKPELEWVFRNFSYFPKWLHTGLKPHVCWFPARNPVLGQTTAVSATFLCPQPFS